MESETQWRWTSVREDNQCADSSTWVCGDTTQVIRVEALWRVPRQRSREADLLQCFLDTRKCAHTLSVNRGLYIQIHIQGGMAELSTLYSRSICRCLRDTHSNNGKSLDASCIWRPSSLRVLETNFLHILLIAILVILFWTSMSIHRWSEIIIVPKTARLLFF
jgi:hypothetical protein